MQRYLRLLRDNPQFAKIWAANVVSLLGDWFNTVVLSAIVSEYSNGSGLAVSLFLLSRLLPPLILSPYAGVLADRFDRKRLMIVSNLVRAGLVPIFLLATTPDQLWLIYLITVLQFSISTVFEPAQNALIPSLVKPEQLLIANTLNNVTWSAMLAIGALVGGVVAAFLGRVAAIIFDAFTFILAASLVAWVRYTPRDASLSTPQHPAHEQDTSFADGLRYLRANKGKAGTLFIKMFSTFGSADALITIIATQIFIIGTGGEISLGILYAAFGVGAFAGPILINRFHDGSVASLVRFVGINLVICTVVWFVMGASTAFWMLCVGWFLRAIGTSTNWTYSSIIIQQTFPDRYLGRMFSLDFMGYYISATFSTLVHGALVDLWGAQNAMSIVLLTGVASLVPMALWALMLRRVQSETGQGKPALVGD